MLHSFALISNFITTNISLQKVYNRVENTNLINEDHKITIPFESC